MLLLFHGVGDNPVAMGEIGSWFAPLFPDALVVSVGGAEPSGNPAGRQWFSVQGITEDNRQARVDAIMVLESIKAEPGLASRVIAFNGRYASLPETASTATTIHLIHGGEDPVIDLAHAVAAQEALISAGGDVTLDIVEDLGHAIDNRSMQFALDHLRYTIPKHYFDEALSGGKPGDDDVIEMM
ncbi:esterase [Escherichia coli]